MVAVGTVRRGALVLGALLSGALSCGPDDIVEVPVELRGDPYCLFVTGTHGYFEDGTRLLIADWDASLVLGGCVCATFEEIETGVREDEMNERALERCERFAATRDFVSNECRSDYESGQWFGSVVRCEPGSQWEGVPPPELRCMGE